VGATDLDKPSITAYIPTNNPTHTAVVVCPGGAYVMLAVDKEGTQVAHWLNARGVAAFVLAYRLGPRYHHPAQLMDAQRAIRYVRANAARFDIAPDKIGIWGFSAGGHLASTAGTHFDAGNSAATDVIEQASSRPDFMVLAYPVISMQPGTTHNWSMHALLGDTPNPALVNGLSNETQVTPQTPPTFLFSTSNDGAVPVMNSVLFYEALLRSGVPAEIHIFEQGPHGTGLAQDYPELRLWPVLLQNWMHKNGWMASGAE
jgi:acetyl esterase/lipase